MKDMHDFDQQIKAYSEKLKATRYPYGDAELNREIRRAVWNTTPGTIGPTPKARHRWWPYAAAVACLAALILPLSLGSNHSAPIKNINIDGEQVYFACNNGCSPEGTIETFKTLIR